MRRRVDARPVDVSSIAAGEYAENNVRKDFTPSERVAIAETIKAEIEKHQGARTDLGQHIGRSERVDDVAARRAGFGNRETVCLEVNDPGSHRFLTPNQRRNALAWYPSGTHRASSPDYFSLTYRKLGRVRGIEPPTSRSTI